MLLGAEQEPALAEQRDDHGIGVLEELARDRLDLGKEVAVVADAVHDVKPVLEAEAQVVLAVGRRDVDDARPVRGRYELGAPHAADVAGGGQIIEQALVAQAIEIPALGALHDFVLAFPERARDELARKDQRLRSRRTQTYSTSGLTASSRFAGSVHGVVVQTRK